MTLNNHRQYAIKERPKLKFTLIAQNHKFFCRMIIYSYFGSIKVD